MDFSLLLGKMFIFVVLMVVGYLFGRKGYVSKGFITDASKLTINFFMVATILNSVISSEIDLSTRDMLLSIAIMTASTVICYIVGAVVSRTVRLPADRRPSVELLLAVVNNVFICLPIVQAAYGPEAVFHISMSGLPYNAILYSYGVWRMNCGEGDVQVNFKKIMSPPLIATLAAIVIFVFRIPMPYVVKDLVSSLSAATMPLSMLVVGASLGSVSLMEAFNDKSSYVVAFFSLIVTPLLAWLILPCFVSDPTLLKTAIIYAACPSGLVVTVLSVQYDRDYVFTSKATLLSTVISMATLPIWVYILG